MLATLAFVFAAVFTPRVPLVPALLGDDKPKPATEAETGPLDVKLGGDEHKRYFLHGLAKDAKAPKEGWKLLVVMPGGDGGPDFAPFVGNLRANALGEDWLVAQLVAPKWDDAQGETNVWPTKKNPYPKMKFACEELFADVLADVGKRCKLDPKFLHVLAWSSSGSLAYTLLVQEKSPVTGAFVAMSVFKPDLLPSLKGAKGKRVYVLHSPTDFIPIRMAETARDQLGAQGADVGYATYEGGHGWHGDVFGLLRAGFEFLAKGSKSK